MEEEKKKNNKNIKEGRRKERKKKTISPGHVPHLRDVRARGEEAQSIGWEGDVVELLGIVEVSAPAGSPARLAQWHLP